MTAILKPSESLLSVRFTVIGECPSMKNSRQLVTIKGRPAFIKSKKARDYERAASLQIPAADRRMIDVPVKVTIHLFYASQRPDLDEALLLDVMAARYKRGKGKLQCIAPGQYQHEKGERVLVSKGVYVNDRQVREKHIFHAIDKANPRAEVVVEPMYAQQASLIDEIPLDEDEQDDPF